MAVTVNNFIQEYTNPTEGTRKTSYKLYLEIRENSYDVETNSSNVDYTAWIIGKSTTTAFYGSTMNGTIKQGEKVLAEGSAKATSSKPVSSANKYILASGNDDFKHNDDGTLSITLKFIYSSTANHASAGETTATLKLTNIPRASTVTATNAIIEGTSNIKIDKKSDSFTTTITYEFEGESGTVVTKTNLREVPWVIPESFYAKIPSKPSAKCTLTATTYSGTTPVGSEQTTLTITASPEKCRPKATIIAVDSNETTKNLTDGTGNIVVIGKSNILCTIEKIVVPNKGADITSVKVNGVELNNLTKVTFNNATTNVFEVIIEDARGYSNKNYNDENKSVTLGKVDYVDVSINATVERNTPTDGKLNIKFNGKWFNGSFGNTDNDLTVQYKYKEKGTSEYSDPIALTVTLKDNTFSGKALEVEGFDYEKEYVFQVTATDRLSTAPKNAYEIPVNKGKPVYWWDDDSFRVLATLYLNDKNLNSFFDRLPQNLVRYSSSSSGTTKYNRIAKITLNSSYERCYLHGQIVELEQYHALFDVTIAFRLNQDGVTIVTGNTKTIKRTINYSSSIIPYVYITQNDENGTVIELWTLTSTSWCTPSFKMINEVNSDVNKHWDLTPLSSVSEPTYIQKLSFNSDKNIMSVGLSEHTEFTLSGAYTYTTVTLDTLKNSTGNKLTFADNKIVIGDGVSKILVSAQSLTKGIAGSQIINIIKGTSNVESGYHVETDTNSWGTICLTPLLLDVSKGDTIGLQCGASASGTITVGGATFTTLTVEVVE